MSAAEPLTPLKLLPRAEYPRAEKTDPLRYYYWPLLGRMYCRRVELCLAQCTGGQRVLEIGFGSGVTFLNLHEKYREIHGIDPDASVEQLRTVFARRGIETALRNGTVLDLPYPDNHFDTVLLISILEHLKPADQPRAFAEIHRVLKPGGQVVYGVPVERALMAFAFWLLGYNIREHHFSTERDVSSAAKAVLDEVCIVRMAGTPRVLGSVYEVGQFAKRGNS